MDPTKKILSTSSKKKIDNHPLPPKNGIGATIRFGQEIQCLPYAGFFF